MERIWTFIRISLLPVEKLIEILGRKRILVKPLISITKKLDSIKIRKMLPGGDIILLSLFGRGDMTVMNDIYYKNAYDFFEPAKGSTIIDIGAHVGLYSLKVAKKVGKEGIIIAIEPHPRNYKLLCKHIHMNGYTNIVPFERALSDFRGTTKLFIEAASYISHSTIFHRSGEWIKVQATTLDDVARESGIKYVDIIKIDAEGAGLSILMGAEKTLEKTKRLIIAAYHSPTEADEIGKFLLPLGFSITKEDHGVLYMEKSDNLKISATMGDA